MEEDIHSNKNKFVSRKSLAAKNKEDKDEGNEIEEKVVKGSKFSRMMDRHRLLPAREPLYDEDSVILSWYDSDLNLVIDEKNFTAASPLHERGFCYLQAGARATFGFFTGKVCYEVKLLNCCRLLYKEGHLNTHLLRVGWSPRRASLALGADIKSYGYDSTGRASTVGEIMDYGDKFSTGDVVGAYLDLTGEVVVISFTLNGVDLGVAYEVPQAEIQKEPLFPHILTKNISYECHFGGEKPWFPLKSGYTFVGDVPSHERIAGPKRPKSKSDCEIIMMCGLPKSGKTFWVSDMCERNPGLYYIIDIAALVDRMEAKDPERKLIIVRKTRVMGKLLAIAMDRRRNYILDQVNIGRSEQLWKLGLFKSFKRRIVVVVIPDEELRLRIENSPDGPPGDSSWLLQMKAKFVLPTLSCPNVAAVADKVDYVGLAEDEALQLVKQYNHEAWRLGFKPHKNFVIPEYVFNEKQKKVPGSWKDRMPPFSINHNPSGSARWISPPRIKHDSDWQSPNRNRIKEEWHATPREMMRRDWQSPPRKRGSEEWQRSFGNREEHHGKSPFRSREDRPHQYTGHRSDTESPSRHGPSDRWGPMLGELESGGHSPPRNPARSRIEDWQSRGARFGNRQDSPLRDSPGRSEIFRGRHSPPRHMIENERFLTDTNRVEAQFPRERSGILNDRFGQLLQAERMEENRVPQGTVPLHERFTPGINLYRENSENRIGGAAQLQDDRASGHFPPFERRGEFFPSREPMLMVSCPPEEERRGGNFSPSDGRLGSDFLGPVDGMDRGPSFRESDLPMLDKRIGVISHPDGEKMRITFATNDNRIEFPPQEGRGRSDHYRQNVRCSVDRFGSNFLPVDSNMPDRFPPQDKRMGGDISPREGRIGNFVPSEGRGAGDLLIHEGRLDNDMLFRGGIGRDFSPHRRIIDGNFVRLRERMEEDFLSSEGRIGSNLSHLRGRMHDLPPSSGRIVHEMSPHDHRESGDMLLHQERSHHNFLSHEGRLVNDLPIRGNRIGDQIISDTLPPHEGRMDSIDMLRHTGRIGDLELHGGRIENDLPTYGRAVGGDLLRQGRFCGDVLPPGERARGDLEEIWAPGGRHEDDLPPHKIRIGGDLPPYDGRSRSGDRWNRLASTGDFPENFEPSHKQAWPDERGMMHKESHFDNARASGRNHPDSSPWVREDRLLPEGHWESPQSEFQHNVFKSGPLANQDQGHGSGFRFHEDNASLNSHSESAGRLPPDARVKGNWEPEVGRTGGGGWQDDLGNTSHQPDRILHHFNTSDTRDQNFPQQRGDSREPDSNRPHFLDNRTENVNVSGPSHWRSPSASHSHSHDRPSPKRRPRHNSRSPLSRKRPDHYTPVGSRQEHPSPASGQESHASSGTHTSRRNSPVRPFGGDGRSPHSVRMKEELQSPRNVRTKEHHQSPLARRMADERQSPPSGRGVSPIDGQSNRDQSPIDRRSTGCWQAAGDGGSGSGWQTSQDRNRGRQRSQERRAPSERLTPNIGGEKHSPPRKQARIESRKHGGLNVPFPDGEEGRNSHRLADWPSPEPVQSAQKLRESSRDSNHGRSQQEMEGLNTENEELAPYEQPFNQAVWDSNEPDAGIYRQGASDCSSRRNLHRAEEMGRNSNHESRQDIGPPVGSRPRGSVWQRVGGYVDDDDKDRNSREIHGHNRYANRCPPGSYGERTRHSIGETKGRSRHYDESRNRRGPDNSNDKTESLSRKRASPFRGGRDYSRELPRDHWKSPAKKRGTHW